MDPIKVGDKEYQLDELQSLIDKGSYAIEMENTYNTDFKNAWSAYGKSQNQVKELQTKLDELTTAKPDAQQPVSQTQVQQPDFDAVFRDKGVVTKQELDQMLEERLSYREQVQQIAGKFKELESSLDGKDGRPKFESKSILDYMQQHPGLTDPETAYNMMHVDQIATWKAEQLNKKPGFAPSNTGSTVEDKRPARVPLTRDTLGAALSEELNSSGGKV